MILVVDDEPAVLAAAARILRDHGYAPPSLIWPQDRYWFPGAPIYTNELGSAAPTRGSTR